MPQPFLGDHMKLTHTLTAMGTAALLATASLSAQAAQKICVYDMLGASGDLFKIGRAHV